MLSNNNFKKIISTLLFIIFTIAIMSSGVSADETVVLDNRAGEGDDVDNLQEAIELVDDGGKIIIKQNSQIRNPYDGAKIGKEDNILSDSKSITIEGEGLVLLKAPDGQDSVIETVRNNKEDIKLKNVMFTDSQHAIEARSGSKVIVEDVAISSTIEDKPFILNDNIQNSGDVNGAKIQENGVYYPESMSTIKEDLVESINGELEFIDIEMESSGLIYERTEDVLDYNPVTTSNYERNIVVGTPTDNLDEEDDDNLQTNYYSLQAAINDAAPGAVITLYPRDEPYGDIEFTGEGTSGNRDITIQGQDNEGIPEITSVEGNYPGEYNIRNVNIVENVVADSDGVDLDVSKNYWGSSNGPTENNYTVTTGTSADILTDPFCTGSDCSNEYGFDDLNQCIRLESKNNIGTTIESSSYGCEESTEEINIDIGGFSDMADSSRIQRYDFAHTDYREANVDVETNINEDTNIKFNVISSDNSVDEEIDISADENSASGTIEAQFATIISQLEKGDPPHDIESPRVYITINNNQIFVITLDDTSVSHIPDDAGVIELPDTAGQTPGNITSDDFEGKIKDETTYVSRFNSNNENDVAFHDNLIPPTQQSGGEINNPARGTVDNFEELRTNPDRAAIIRPENPLNIGMAIKGISEAEGHTLSITYAVQGEDTANNYIDTKIVDEQSDELYTSRPPSASELEVTSTTDRPFENSGDTEDLETKTKEIPLTSNEVDYINENGEMYVVFENMDIDINTVLLLYNVEVNSTDDLEQIEEDREEAESGDEASETVTANPEERPGGFTTSFTVDGNLNSDYDTYDVEPDNELSKTVTIENTGDTTIEGDFAIIDEYEPPEIRFPNEGQLDNNLESSEEEITRIEELKVAGGETESIMVSNSWSESEFGNHTLKFVEIDENGDYVDLDPENGVTPQFDVYVFQPATFEISEINVPDEHLIYDNFNSDIKVQNIGDLPGERTMEVEYGDWETEKTISLGSGNAREGTTSESNTIRFYRDNHELEGEESNFDFTFKEYTTASDFISHDYDSYSGPFETEYLTYEENDTSNYRPNAPFGMTEGEHPYEVTIINDFDNTDATWPRLYDEYVMNSEESETVVLNEIVINNLEVTTKDGGTTQRPTEDDTIHANAYPYVQPSYGIDTSEVNGETYVESGSVRGGLSTMYSYNVESGDRNTPANRGSTPLNNENIPSISQPEDRYFSIYYNHQNRYCNEDLYGEEDVHVPESEADESDTNVFLPYSADTTLGSEMCSDRNRYTSLQLPRFEGTTDNGLNEENRNINHPAGDYVMRATNQDTFEDIEEDESVMYASVTVSNPSGAQPATARFEIQSNKSTNERGHSVGLGENGDHQIIEDENNMYDDNVVGVGAVELRPEETKQVNVPIVIKNDAGNEGVHILSVHPRDDEDYIRRSNNPESPDELGTSELTGDVHSQYQVPVNVDTYGDAIIENFEAKDSGLTPHEDDSELAHEADTVVNQVCTSEGPSGNSRLEMEFGEIVDGTSSPDLTEGLNPKSGNQERDRGGVQDDGECDPNEQGTHETAEFEATYTNYGGEEIDVRPEAIAEFQSKDHYTMLHRQNAQLTGDRYFAEYMDDVNTNFDGETWSNIEVDGEELTDTTFNLQPGETRNVTFERKFQEPGLYHVRVAPCRQIGSSGPQHYNLDGFTGIPDTIDYPSGSDRVQPTNERFNTALYGANRGSDNMNPVTTPEMGNGIFNGALGCTSQTSSAFVYDITNPVADFHVGHSETTIMDDVNEYTNATTESGEFENTIETIYNEDFDDGNAGRFNLDSGSIDSGEQNIKSTGSRSEHESEFGDDGYLLEMRGGGYATTNEIDFTGHRQVWVMFETGADHIGTDDDEALYLDYKNSEVGDWQRFERISDDSDDYDSGGPNSHHEWAFQLPRNAYEPDTKFRFSYENGQDFLDDQWFIDNFEIEGRTVADNPDADYLVSEGGMLFLDGSSYDCLGCYKRPHFDTYELETLTDSPDFPANDPGIGNDFRGSIKNGGSVFSYRMSTDNTRIAGAGMQGEYPDGRNTDERIVEKGMEWNVEGEEPNYGQENFCTDVDESQVDEHCYMEQFSGDNGDGSTPDYYEVVPHRFTEVTNGFDFSNDPIDVELQVWDDPTLTRGEANTNSSTISIDVIEDVEDPVAEIEHENFNDLSYDKESGQSTVWHRMENIYSNVDYRNTPNNFGSNNKYDDTYEGTRTCFSTDGYDNDNDIGIAQSAWWQDGGNGLIDDGTRVIDDGNYVDRIDGGIDILNLHHIDVDRQETRDGNRRCLIFEEEGPNGDKERNQIFEYEVFDYADKNDIDTTTVEIETDSEKPSIDKFEPKYDTSTGNNPDGSDVGWIWAHHDETEFDGDDVQFDIEASDSGVGIACLDVRLNVGEGLTYGNEDIHNNCQSMGDQNGDASSPPYEGTHDNDAVDGAKASVGSEQTPGEHSTNNYFSASELGNSYNLPQNNPSTNDIFTISQEKLYATDWHGNTKENTINIDVRVDGTSPTLDGTYTCSGSSCSRDTVTFNSEGPDGGTHIVDAEVVDGSVSGQEDSCRITGDDDGNSDCTYDGTSAQVINFDQYDFDGTVEVDVDSSIDAYASVETASASCSGCGDSDSDSTDVTVEAEASGEFDLRIKDAHGNIQTKTYEWNIDDEDSDSDSDSCSTPSCDDE